MRPKIGIGKVVKLTLSEEEWKELESISRTPSSAIRRLLLRSKMDKHRPLPPLNKENV